MIYSMDVDIPVFGKILDLIVHQSDCLFVLQPYDGTFNTHYNAYEVHTNSSQYLFCKQKDFVDHHILSISKSFSSLLSHSSFVSLKYHVFR